MPWLGPSGIRGNPYLAAVTATGGVLILAIGLLRIREVRAANFLR